MPNAQRPSLEFYYHIEGGEGVIKAIQEAAREALPHCLASPGPGTASIGDLETVEINLVSDDTIAGVHGEFMDDPTPTDVITFHHGEILVSLETARREAPRHGHSTAEETLLYLIHGLLHLNGHMDLEEEDRNRMHVEQNRILRSVFNT